VRNFVAVLLCLRRGITIARMTDRRARYLPTPDEIAAACEELQRKWTSRIVKNRESPPQEQVQAARWRVPTFHLDPDLAAELDSR
jgi:hypothetical protein